MGLVLTKFYILQTGRTEGT